MPSWPSTVVSSTSHARHSERALELAEEQFGLHPPQHIAVLGLVDLWSGNPSTGAVCLAAADRQAVRLGWGEPSLRWWTPDHVELLLGHGQLDEAARLLDTWEADAVRVGRELVLAHVTRCRGLVAAANGDVGRALELLEEAVAAHGRVGDPFGRARALLALGVVGRRARQKRPAREAIEAAAEAFEEIGAAGWAATARSELGAVGGRRQAEGLTAAERRVASLVAEGKTNREVAAALFLRAHRGEPSDARLRKARRALADRARAAARVGRAGGRAQHSDVLTFPPWRKRPSVERVPSYLVETYLTRGRTNDGARASDGRARPRRS